MVFSTANTNSVPAAHGQSHPVLAPLIAAIFALGLLLVPVIQSAATGTSDIPLFNPNHYTAEQLAGSTLHDGIPDVWKIYYGLSTIDPNVANDDYTGSGVMNREKYQLNIHPLPPADTLPQASNQKTAPQKQAKSKSTALPAPPAPSASITKGDFSGTYKLPNRVGINIYGFKISASWGYVKDGQIGSTINNEFHGWVSAGGKGGEIEVWSLEVNGVKRQFVELDASKNSHGIKQVVQNAAPGTYLLTWNHMGRNVGAAGKNDYFVKVYLTDGQNELAPALVTANFPQAGKPINKTRFEPQAVAFTVKADDLKMVDGKPTRKLWICFDCPQKTLNTFGTFIDDVRLQPIEIDQPTVDAQGNGGALSKVDDVRFSRWWNAYPDAAPFSLNKDFIKNDPDRFVIKIPAAIAPDKTTIKAKLSTKAPQGLENGSEYEQAATEITLTKKGDWYESNPMILVTNKEDGDETKTGLKKAQNDTEDATIIAWMGSKLEIVLTVANNTKITFPVSQAKKKVTLDTLIVDAQAGGSFDNVSADYATQASRARETFAQELIQLETPAPRKVPFQGAVLEAVVIPHIENKDSPGNLTVFSYSTNSGLHSETELLLNQCLDLYQRPEKTIRVLYLPVQTTNSNVFIVGKITKIGYTDPKSINGTTLSSNILSAEFPGLKLGKFEGTILMLEGEIGKPMATSTLAHEVGHALDLFHVSETSPLDGAIPTPEDPWHRLMLRILDSAPLNTKRFAPSEHQKFETKPSVYFKTSTAP